VITRSVLDNISTRCLLSRYYET